MLENQEAGTASFLLDRRVELTLDALTQIGRYLSGFEGRKNLIWYSGSFPAAVLPDRAKNEGSQAGGVFCAMTLHATTAGGSARRPID